MTPMSMTILSAYADNSPPIGGEYEDEHHCFCAWLDPHPARQAANRRTGHEHYCDLQPQASRAPVHSFIDTRPGNQSSTERTHGALYRYDWLLFAAVHERILCLHALDDPGRYERRKPCSLNHSNKNRPWCCDDLANHPPSAKTVPSDGWSVASLYCYITRGIKRGSLCSS